MVHYRMSMKQVEQLIWLKHQIEDLYESVLMSNAIEEAAAHPATSPMPVHSEKE